MAINYWKRDKHYLGNAIGSKKKLKVSDIIERTDEYFEQCFENGDENGHGADMIERPSVSGYALFVFGGYSQMQRYENEGGKVKHYIDKAKTYIERFYEDALFDPMHYQGAKFALGAMCGWSEKQENKNHNTNVNYEIDLDDLN